MEEEDTENEIATPFGLAMTTSVVISKGKEEKENKNLMTNCY